MIFFKNKNRHVVSQVAYLVFQGIENKKSISGRKRAIKRYAQNRTLSQKSRFCFYDLLVDSSLEQFEAGDNEVDLGLIVNFMIISFEQVMDVAAMPLLYVVARRKFSVMMEAPISLFL